MRFFGEKASFFAPAIMKYWTGGSSMIPFSWPFSQ